MTQPDLARLEGLLTRLRTMGCYGHKPYPTHFINPDGEEAATEIEALLARVRELESVVEPFAREGRNLVEQQDAYSWRNTGLSNANLRRAALTLNKEPTDADR